VLGALTRGDLAPHLDPGREVRVIPGELKPCLPYFTARHLDRGLLTHQHAAGRRRSLGEAFHNLDGEPAGGQGPEAIQAPLVEVDGGAPAVNPHWLGGKGELADLDHDRTFGQENHRAFGLGIAAEGDRVKAQGRVLVEPDSVAVGEDHFHPRLAGSVHAVARHKRHVDCRFEALVLVGGQNRGVPFEVRDVAQ
jgi:hypothetical protein